jgi:hypothetical protein
MKKKVLLALALVSAVAALAVPAGLATTEPALNVTIVVKITDKNVVFSSSVVRRGWRAHFLIKNLGKKPHTIDIGGLRTKSIKPGSQAKLGAELEDRGRFPYKVDGGGPRYVGFFSVI